MQNIQPVLRNANASFASFLFGMQIQSAIPPFRMFTFWSHRIVHNTQRQIHGFSRCIQKSIVQTVSTPATVYSAPKDFPPGRYSLFKIIPLYSDLSLDDRIVYFWVSKIAGFSIFFFLWKFYFPDFSNCYNQATENLQKYFEPRSASIMFREKIQVESFA